MPSGDTTSGCYFFTAQTSNILIQSGSLSQGKLPEGQNGMASVREKSCHSSLMASGGHTDDKVDRSDPLGTICLHFHEDFNKVSYKRQ